MPLLARLYTGMQARTDLANAQLSQQEIADILRTQLGWGTPNFNRDSSGYGSSSRDRDIDRSMGGSGAMGGDREGRDYGGMA